MDVGCGGVGLGYGGSAELPLQVALVSLRNRPGAMFLCNHCCGDSGPLLPCHAFPQR